MRKGLFSRLAVVNIRKNKQIYVPYILACLFNVAMLYMMLFINHNAGMKTIRHSGDVLMITTMGVGVIVIFSFIFLLYSNSFLMKRRQKELGLYASATGIVYETKKALKDFKEATTLRDLDEVTAKDIFDAAKEGDTFAKERVDDLGQKLALAAGNIALMVDPEVFVIGGGVSRAGQILLDAVNAHFKKYTFGKAQETGFVLATLGNDAGIYGAASLMLS